LGAVRLPAQPADEALVRILLDTSVIIDLAEVELGVHESATGLERLLDVVVV
jgi:hypothetical protein